MTNDQEGGLDLEALSALRNRVRAGANPELVGASLLPAQLQNEVEKLYDEGNLTPLDGTQIRESIKEKGYYILPSGTRVMARVGFFTSKDHKRTFYYDIGEIEIPNGGTEVTYFGGLPRETGDNSRFSQFSPDSPQLRKLSRGMDEVNSELNRLDASEPTRLPEDYVPEVREVIEQLYKKASNILRAQQEEGVR